MQIRRSLEAYGYVKVDTCPSTHGWSHLHDSPRVFLQPPAESSLRLIYTLTSQLGVSELNMQIINLRALEWITVGITCCVQQLAGPQWPQSCCDACDSMIGFPLQAVGHQCV